MNTSRRELHVRKLGLVDYAQCLALMQSHIQSLAPKTHHELWVVEHPSVYSQGQAGKPHHLLNLGAIPLVQSDRGGQVTYHGPGQLICYFMFDLQRLGLNVRQLVDKTTDSVIKFLGALGISAHDDPVSPGVYVETTNADRSKIASLGFRVRRHMSYHGVAINMAMDLSPFRGINPCGLTQSVCQASDFMDITHQSPSDHLQHNIYISHLINTFAFDNVIVTPTWPVLTGIPKEQSL